MKKIIFGLAVLITFSGCVSFKPVPIEGGVFKSEDYGETWTHKIFVAKGEKADLTIGKVSVIEMKFDPEDSGIIYIGTIASGGFVTKNKGDNWERLGPASGSVQNISINPKDTKEIYLTQNNAIYKSIDKGISWNMIYTEPRNVIITDLEVDAFNPQKVYMSLADGQLQKSDNAGLSWTVVNNFNSLIHKFLLDPRDTRRMYVFTEKKGIYKTINLGLDWAQIKDELADFEYALRFKDAVFDFSKKDSVYYVSQYGIIRTSDGGKTWQDLPLLTPPNTIEIHTVEVNPETGVDIYYTTPTKFYKTDDGGKSWTIKPLPSLKSAKILRIDPTDFKILYMGMQNPLKKKSSFIP